MENYNNQSRHYVMSYTRKGNTELTDCMHLAFSSDDVEYVPLNYNTGILFPKADFDENDVNSKAGTSKRMLFPYLFRMKDGKIGIIAVRTDDYGDVNASGKIMLYITQDLIQYEYQGLLSLNTDLKIYEPRCEYEAEEKKYRINWKDEESNYYENTFVDFTCISDPVKIFNRKEVHLSCKVEGSNPVNVLQISESEATKLTMYLMEPENTCISNGNITFFAEVGERLSINDLSATVELGYKDGSACKKRVIWDTDSINRVNYNLKGTYMISGILETEAFEPCIDGRADPFIFLYLGVYYFISTDDNSDQKSIYIRESKTMEGLFHANDTVLMSDNKIRWAPEVHEINGKFYLFLAIGDGKSSAQWRTVQCHILELKENGDPTNINDWKKARQVSRKDHNNLYDKGITLDMTYFEANGISYLVWAQREITDDKGVGTSDLYIATIDNANPYLLTSEPTCILRPQYGWNRIDTTVVEGPCVIQRSGKVFLTFSGTGVGNQYCVGLLTADFNSDLTNPMRWSETCYPVLMSESVPGEFGPGHNSFVQDDKGDSFIVYHFKPDGKNRSATARRIHWSADGTPRFDMTISREAKEDYSTIIGSIVVGNGGQVLSYVICGGNQYLEEGDFLASSDSRRSDALHLALRSSNTEPFEVLNHGKAVAYVKWDGEQKQNPNNQIGSPALFRKSDGSLGLVASGNNRKKGIYVWDSTMNLSFVNERYIVITEQEKSVMHPLIIYIQEQAYYHIYWQDTEGNSYVSIMLELEMGNTRIVTRKEEYKKRKVVGELPDNAVPEEASIFDLTKEEYYLLQKRYGRIENIGIVPVTIHTKVGKVAKLPESIEVVFNDGSKRKIGVEWQNCDLEVLNTTQPGTYKIRGKVKQDNYTYPFVEERADPYLFYNEDDQYYYLSGSYYESNLILNNIEKARDKSYRKLCIRRAKTINELKNAKEHYILESKICDRWGAFIWAPEFHKINGTWYCIVGAHDFGEEGISGESDWGWCSNTILIPYMGSSEKLIAGGMLDSIQWGEPIILNLPSPADATFDISYYQDKKGQGYYIVPKDANLYLIKVKGGEGVVPQPEGEARKIKSGEWPWEYGIHEGSINHDCPNGKDQLVIEGPYMFEYNDKVYITYSAATVDKFYCIGLMMADRNSDLLNPYSWENLSYPILSSYDTIDSAIGGLAHVGGGHNSIAMDENGNLLVIYHARPYPDPHKGLEGAGGLFDPCRNTMVQKVHISSEGILILNLGQEEKIKPEFANIKATVSYS